jgi:pimeloyl-ACP methyl ester carboxylesterase
MMETKKMAEQSEFKVPGWYRRSFQLAAKAVPSLASTWAMNLFFTPWRPWIPPEERAALNRGQRFSFESSQGQVVGWSWGAGAPVLLVHGWSGHAGQLARIAENLALAGYRAIALDLPAHGQSSGKRTSFVHFADAIAVASRLFDPLQAIIAHSLGAAAVTLALKRQSLRVDRAVFIAPTAELEGIWARFRRGVGLTPIAWQGMREKSEHWLRVSFEDLIPVRVAPSLSTPLLIVHDQQDREIPIDEARSLRAAWPGAELHETSHLGHVRILRDPGVSQRIVQFLSAADSRGEAA